MKQDAKSYVKRCNWCQQYALIPRVPSKTLNLVTITWLFAQWGMDIVDPLPTRVAQKKFFLIATDYFSKSVEAKAYASIKDKDVSKFIWKNIVCQFRIPWAIVTNNGPQFDSTVFWTFCSKLNIKNLYSTPCYSQSNGQIEMTNKTPLNALKKRLEWVKGKWVDEFLGALWAY